MVIELFQCPQQLLKWLRKHRDASGVLPPAAIGLVPNSRVAHWLKANGEGLSGISFTSAIELATSLLLAQRIVLRPELDRTAALRLEMLIDSAVLDDELAYFKGDQLRQGVGYARALAATLAEMSAASVTPDDLRQRAEATDDDVTRGRLRDLAMISERVQAQGAEWSSNVLKQAANVLQKNPAVWPCDGPTFAWIDERTSNAELEFLAVVPRLAPVGLDAHPMRPESKQRWQYVADVLGDHVFSPDAIKRPQLPTAPLELDIVKTALFLDPEARASLPSSAGPDGSVRLDEYAGVEDEVEAAVQWVAHQVHDVGRPLERIALLATDGDAYLPMLFERLAALPWEKDVPVLVAGGLPSTSLAGTARLLALLDALESNLAVDSMARLLPYLKLRQASDDDPRRLSSSQAIAIAYYSGTLGGQPGDPEKGQEWTEALRRRRERFEVEIAEYSAHAPDDPQHMLSERNLAESQRQLKRVVAVQHAVAALVDLHEKVLTADLSAIWEILRSFCDEHLVLPGADKKLPATLEKALRPVLSWSDLAAISGQPALRCIRQALLDLRVQTGRFGEPRIYLGSVAGAVGLEFDAVRILGLSEGSIPANVTVDAILPDEDRRQLDPDDRGAIPLRAYGSLQGLQAFYRVVQATRQQLVISFARQSADGTIKEPSGLFLEVAAAVGRSGAVGTVKIPTTAELRQLYFSEPDLSSEDARLLTPFGITRQAAHRDDAERVALPAVWVAAESNPLNLDRMRELQRTLRTSAPGAMDGVLPAGWPLPRPRGLDPAMPLSATRAQRLIECPHRFFFEDIIGWQEPERAPSMRRIDTLPYGTLLHRVAENFIRRHGAEFTGRKESLSHWLATAQSITEETFHDFLETYPLLDGPVRQQELHRLQRDIGRLLRYEWEERPGLKFLAVEQPFGYPEPVKLQLGEHVLYLQGFMDRLDIAGEHLLIRDVKSGSAHPRLGDEADATHTRDVQLALYALAAEAMRAAGQADWPPVGEVAYVYASDIRSHPERCFGGAELSEFLQQGRSWLGVGAALLEARLFPQSPIGDDCKYCPFATICDSRLSSASQLEEKLSLVDGPQAEAARSFLELKLGVPEDTA